jgi:hypothetical protein
MRLRLWDVVSVTPLRPEGGGPVARAWTPWGAARIARAWSKEAEMMDVSHYWRARWGGLRG